MLIVKLHIFVANCISMFPKVQCCRVTGADILQAFSGLKLYFKRDNTCTYKSGFVNINNTLILVPEEMCSIHVAHGRVQTFRCCIRSDRSSSPKTPKIRSKSPKSPNKSPKSPTTSPKRKRPSDFRSPKRKISSSSGSPQRELQRERENKNMGGKKACKNKAKIRKRLQRGDDNQVTPGNRPGNSPREAEICDNYGGTGERPALSAAQELALMNKQLQAYGLWVKKIEPDGKY